MIAKLQSSTKRSILVSIGLCLSFFGLIAIFVFSGPWRRLEAKFPDRQESGVQFLPLRSLVVRDADSRAPFAFNDASEFAIGPDAIKLRLTGPYRFFRNTLRIPAESVIRCDVSKWESGTETNVWLKENQTVISVADEEGNVLDWCHGIKRDG